jgi:hypothetical protein
MNLRLTAGCGLVLVCVQACAGQVIFSRRVYREHGRTYQQLWEWNPATGSLRALTHSARDHVWPVCKDGGKRIQFVSPEEYGINDQLWVFDRTTGAERMLAGVYSDFGRDTGK